MTTLINEILEFAPNAVPADGAILALNDYAADNMRLSGHQPGVARMELENTALRQVTRFCRGVAEFIAERYEPGVVDDGDAEKIVAGLEAAINALITAGVPPLAILAEAVAGQSNARLMTPQMVLAQILASPTTIVAGGTASALTGSLSNAPQTALADKMLVFVRAGAANPGAVTINLTLGTTATGDKPVLTPALQALSGGEIAGPGAVLILQWNAAYNSGSGGWVLVNGSAALPSDLARLDVAQAWTRLQAYAVTSRTAVSGAQAVDLDQNPVLFINANGDLIISNPTGKAMGKQHCLLLYSTSARTISWGTDWHGTSLGGLTTLLPAGKLIMISTMCVTTPAGTYMVPFGLGQEA